MSTPSSAATVADSAVGSDQRSSLRQPLSSDMHPSSTTSSPPSMSLPSTALISDDPNKPSQSPPTTPHPHTPYHPRLASPPLSHLLPVPSPPLSPPPLSAISYDSLLSLIGTGAFHYQLLLLCGWANAADAVEILAASFIMYAARDLHLTDSNKGWIAAMVFAGMLLGGWVWGSLADRLGRKTCLMLALFTNSVGGIMAAFVGSYHGMLLCRFVAGLGVGGSIPVIFTYFIEFLPTAQRGQFMVYLAWFWMVGAIFTAAAAWAIIPLDMSTTTFLITPFDSWRLFTLLCALPSLLCGCLLTFCPESPRFLLTQRKVGEAKLILSSMFAINHPALFGGVGMQAEWCGLCCLTADGGKVAGVGRAYGTAGAEEVEPIIESKEAADEGGDAQAAFERELAGLDLAALGKAGVDLSVPTYAEEAAALLDKTRVLFTGQHVWHSAKLMVVWFGLSFGYYGITLWIPETFAHLNPDAQSVLDPYSSAFLSAACNLPGNIVSVYTVRALGRTLTLSTSIAASTLAVLLVPFASSPWAVTSVLSVFTLVSVGAWNALNICTTELYDTEVRSTAFGVMAAVGRMGAILGNVLFGEFIGGSVLVPMMITAGFLLASAIAAWRLKETKDEVLT